MPTPSTAASDDLLERLTAGRPRRAGSRASHGSATGVGSNDAAAEREVRDDDGGDEPERDEQRKGAPHATRLRTKSDAARARAARARRRGGTGPRTRS